MKFRSIATCLVLSALSSCFEVEVDVPAVVSGRRPVPQEDADRHVWMSALVYPDSYDWQRDTAAVDPGRVALLCDGRIVLILEDSNSWTGHFVLAGHLYSWARRDGRTVVSRDGEEHMGWEGEELVRDMAISKGSLYCMCTPSDGSSVSVRKDCETLAAYEGCWPDSRFYEDGDSLCFDMCGRRILSVCGSAEKPAVLPKVDKLVSASSRIVDGKIWLRMEYTQSGRNRTSIGTADRPQLYVANSPEEFSGLLYGGSSVLVEKRDSRGNYLIIKDSKQLYGSGVPFERVMSVCEGDDVVALGRAVDGSWTLFDNGVLAPLPDGMRPVASGSPALRYGKLLIPLIRNDGRAAVLDGGKPVELGFNGYVDRIVIGCGSSRKIYLSY